MKLIEPIIRYREDFCFNCNREALELFDFFNRPMNYKAMISNRLNNREWNFNKAIYQMKCTRCGTVFVIGYTNDNFPYPIVYLEDPHKFINDYIKLGHEKEKDLIKL